MRENVSAWHDEGLQRTNPVLVVKRLLDDLEPQFVWSPSQAQMMLAQALEALDAAGSPLPAFERERLRPFLPRDFPSQHSPRPGVLGLLVAPGTELNLVLPLRCQLSCTRWDKTLPFGPESVMEGLVRLIQSTGLPTAGVIPERLTFGFTNPLGYRAVGNSMTVAAVLAVLDALDGNQSEVLRCASALVEPSDENRLRPVDYCTRKLDAILREHDGGSLLVIHSETNIPNELRRRFASVWPVANYADLAIKLAEDRLLAPLLKKTPLHRAESLRVRDSLHWLVRQEHNYLAAADLGKRLRDCERAPPVDPSIWMEIAKLNAESCRHHGRFSAAVELGQEVLCDVTSLGDLTSEDEQADATAEHAAALFDNHDFDSIPPLLECWSKAAVADPRRFQALTRVKIWNTLGRALAILGRDGWEPLFQRCLELHSRRNDSDNVDRTMTYRVHALLRAGRSAEADTELTASGLRRNGHLPDNPWLAFLLADVARISGTCWPNWDLERWAAVTRPKHAVATFFQTVSRQNGRSQEEAVKLLRRGADLMKEEAGPIEGNICRLFASMLELSAAAYASDVAGWTSALSAIHRFLDRPDAGSICSYYLPAFETLPRVPNTKAVELLLKRVPYF